MAGKKLKVVVSEGRPDMRGVLKTVLKNIGLKDAIACASLDEVTPMLEDPAQRPDWIICSMDLNEKVNALQLLRLSIEYPELRDVKVSVTVDEAELKYMPTAFELGALSYHMKPFSQQGLEGELKYIQSELSEHEGHEYLIAAKYLKDSLAALERFEDLLHLEKRLVNHFPKQAIFMLNLAEAYFLSGDVDNAKKVLSKARFLGDDIRGKVIEVLAMVAPGEDVNSLEPFASAFGIKNAFIVDGDSTESRRGNTILNNLGLEKIEVFETSDTAMDYMYDGEFTPDLIIMEWKLRSIGGAALIQRLQTLMDDLPPIVVTSSHLTKADHMLLYEMGVSYVLEKPYQDEEMIRGVFDAVKSTAQPAGVKDLMFKLKEAAYTGDREAGKEAHSAIVRHENLPTAVKATADGLWNYLNKDYVSAKDNIVLAIKESKDSVLLIDLLGKTLINLDQKEAAIKCFMKAAHLSPLNIERLCETAEICSETGEGAQANEILEDARKVDSESDRVILAESRVALNLGDTEKAQAAVSKMGNLGQLISYMNNRAVVMVRDEQVEQALALYDDALQALPEDRTKEKSVILFNKGMALARLQQGEDAVGVLREIQQSDDEVMYQKASKLAKKIESLLAAGKQISFAKKQDEMVEMADRPTAMHVFPGQLRLHLIFECDETMNDDFIRSKLSLLVFRPQDEKKSA